MNVEMLDAPVSGGRWEAQNAALSIMWAGEAEVFEKIKPYFQLMGQEHRSCRGNGDGQTCKVVNQIVVALEYRGRLLKLSCFASKAGADPV